MHYAANLGNRVGFFERKRKQNYNVVKVRKSYILMKMDMNVQVITVTSKGQVAIPVKMREELKIKTGDKILAYTHGDTIMLKVLKMPDISEFKKEMDDAQKWAKSVGLTQSDVDEAIEYVRKNKQK